MIEHWTVFFSWRTAGRQVVNTNKPGSYLFFRPLVELMEGQYGLSPGGELWTGLNSVSVDRRRCQSVVIVVVRQPDAGAASRGFLLMRRPQLPPPFLQQRLSRFVAQVHPIAARQRRPRVVVFDVADVDFIVVCLRIVQHLSELART